MQLLVIGGSDAGIAAALRARELDPSAEATVVVADAFPREPRWSRCLIWPWPAPASATPKPPRPDSIP